MSPTKVPKCIGSTSDLRPRARLRTLLQAAEALNSTKLDWSTSCLHYLDSRQQHVVDNSLPQHDELNGRPLIVAFLASSHLGLLLSHPGWKGLIFRVTLQPNDESSTAPSNCTNRLENFQVTNLQWLLQRPPKTHHSQPPFNLKTRTSPTERKTTYPLSHSLFALPFSTTNTRMVDDIMLLRKEHTGRPMMSLNKIA